MERVYLVTDGGERRLVRAKSMSAAIQYVAQGIFTITVPTKKELVEMLTSDSPTVIEVAQ